MEENSSVTLVLLKTRSQPDDSYEDYFRASTSPTDNDSSVRSFHFKPIFVPVLEHKQDVEALNKLGSLLRTGQLKDHYGGMIFTSQRAVEGWADTVAKIEAEEKLQYRGTETESNLNYSHVHESVSSTETARHQDISNLGQHEAVDDRTQQPFTTDIHSLTEFPLYTVGPATSRALSTLVTSIHEDSNAKPEDTNNNRRTVSSPFLSLNPIVLGAHTGNGANLATYILQHYNSLQAQKWFTFYEAPRLPFIPILGMGSENYSRKRLESTDSRLAKKALLFLVGEQRRDIIPKTLMDHTRLGADKTIKVEEVEVYSTIVRGGFRKDFDEMVHQWSEKSDINTQSPQPTHQNQKIIVIVVFSPQGSREMLKSIGFLDEEGHPVRETIESRWPSTNSHASDRSAKPTQSPKYIIATIGPTTRDFLKTEIGVEPDVCASKPSPEGVWDGVTAFLKAHNLS